MEIAPLLAMRGFPLSRSGGEMHWRIPGEESVSIRGNMWYSHYRGEGGDAISFARRFFISRGVCVRPCCQAEVRGGDQGHPEHQAGHCLV